jgi:hypothetical protein
LFCVAVLFFGGTEGVGSHFDVLRSRNRFRRCRVHRVPISYFAHPDSFSAVPKASGPVFMFCAPKIIFDGAECVGSRFHDLRARTHFRLYRGRRVPFSCFALPDSFSAVPRASGPIFMFCAPEIVFGGTESVGSLFHVLRARAHFRRYRGHWVPFSCFALPGSFLLVPRASGPVFMFCAPRLVFVGTEGVGSRFHVLRSQVPFSCFVLRDSFSTMPSASGPVFMFCDAGLVFGGIEGVGSRFHVLRSLNHFRRCRGRRVPFSCFALLDSFSAVPGATGPFFLFFAPGLVFGGIKGVGSHFHVLRSRNRFRR